MSEERPTSDVGDALRDERPGGLDLDAEKWRSDVAARLFGAPKTEIRIGRYVVLESVGQGATGIVYAATDPELDRKVAIKLLKEDAVGSRTDTWLAREAKTLARLSHPNVVPVYDVGTHRGQVFMALEFVTGRTLGQWMKDSHALEEIVDIFVQAGRGLAAAHEAGLVHRDFKPENVLIGDDGRVRVSDFGIARHLDREASMPTGADSGVSIGDAASGNEQTTHRGAGTPAYMAPEQFLGDEVDARTDQFAFCVALHEALYGRRPFAGGSRAKLAANVIAGRRKIPSSAEPLPAWLDRVIERGLSVRPEDRFPTLAALLGQLRQHREPKRGRWVALGAVGAGLSVAAFAWLGEPEVEAPDPCSDGPSKLAGVWNEARAARVRDAFEATGRTYADDSFERVQQTVERYGERWVSVYERACDGDDITDVAVMRRMHCLQSRLLELESLAEVLAVTDEKVLEHSVDSLRSLVAPDECLYVGSGQPEQAPTDAVRDAGSLRGKIARAKVLGDTGAARQGLDLAREAVLESRDLADRSLEAEALLVAGNLERMLAGITSKREAESTIYEAILAAEAAHRPDLVARASVSYLGVTQTLGQFDRVVHWERRARDAVASVGNPPTLLGRIEYTMALVYGFQDRTEESRTAVERSLAAFRRGDEKNRHWLTSSYNLLGELTFEEGRYEDALPFYERALDIAQEERGGKHPWTANQYGNMAEVYYKIGDYETSLQHFRTAFEIRRDVFGVESVWGVHSLGHIGDVLLELGRPREAADAYHRALAARMTLRDLAGEKPKGPEGMISVYTDLQAWDQEQWLRHGLAFAYAEQGEFETALEHTDALPELLEPDDKHHPDLIGRVDVRGQVLLAAGRHDEARFALERARDTIDTWYPKEHLYRAWPRTALGVVALEAGDPQAAREHFEIALRLRLERPEAHARALGDTRFGLARALWALGEQHGGARAFAAAALEDYRRAPNRRPEDVSRVEAWLADHPERTAG